MQPNENDFEKKDFNERSGAELVPWFFRWIRPTSG
jgi:hypothetical protein